MQLSYRNADSPEHVQIGHRAITMGKPAGFWVRAAAEVADVLTVVGIFLVVLWLLDGTTSLRTLWGAVHTLDWHLTPLGYLLWAGIYDVVFTVWGGQTPGKKLLGIRVVSVRGPRVRWGESFARYIGEVICAVTLIGYGLVLVRADRRGLHDLLANTRVVYV